ncbi:hypothetical protein MTR67_019327 [Solanum verrucosum]|uniref:Uncharacterized protein n=1 Tax=Solanum verrucosum TaxID=315347 RepID=A0AAF0TMD1_SOLVR|nr:hypothetical protein MTR67_019327 [Solanum verrucosum]
MRVYLGTNNGSRMSSTYKV